MHDERRPARHKEEEGREELRVSSAAKVLCGLKKEEAASWAQKHLDSVYTGGDKRQLSRQVIQAEAHLGAENSPAQAIARRDV